MDVMFYGTNVRGGEQTRRAKKHLIFWGFLLDAGRSVWAQIFNARYCAKMY